MTEPPATTQLSPIVVPLRINVFAPIQTLLPIIIGEVRNPIALI